MKYTKETIDTIRKSLEDGDGRVRACKKANISYETFLDWQDIDSPRFSSEFSELVKKAENVGNDKIKDICKRRIIENNTWQSAAWWLERNYPAQYRVRNEIDIKNTDGSLKDALPNIVVKVIMPETKDE